MRELSQRSAASGPIDIGYSGPTTRFGDSEFAKRVRKVQVVSSLTAAAAAGTFKSRNFGCDSFRVRAVFFASVLEIRFFFSASSPGAALSALPLSSVWRFRFTVQ